MERRFVSVRHQHIFSMSFSLSTKNGFWRENSIEKNIVIFVQRKRTRKTIRISFQSSLQIVRSIQEIFFILKRRKKMSQLFFLKIQTTELYRVNRERHRFLNMQRGWGSTAVLSHTFHHLVELSWQFTTHCMGYAGHKQKQQIMASSPAYEYRKLCMAFSIYYTSLWFKQQTDWVCKQWRRTLQTLFVQAKKT